MNCLLYMIATAFIFTSNLFADTITGLAALPPNERYQQLKQNYLADNWGGANEKQIVDALIPISKLFESERYEKGYLLAQSLILLYSPMRRDLDRKRIGQKLFKLKPRLISNEPFIKSFYYFIQGQISFFGTDDPNALKYYLEAKELLHGPELVPINYVVAKSFDWNGKLQKAIKISLENLELIKKYEFHSWEISAYEQLGDLYNSLEDYARSIDYSFLALNEAKKKQDYNKMVGILNTIGRSKNSLGDAKRAIEYLKQAVDLFGNNTVKPYEKVFTYYHLSNNYLGINEFQKAEENIIKAIEIAERNQFTNEILSAKIQKASIYLVKDKLQDAMLTLEEISKIDDEHWDTISKAQYYRLLAEINLRKGNYSEAQDALDKAIPLTLKFSTGLNISYVYKIAADYYKAIKDFKKAAHYQNLQFTKDLEIEKEKNRKLLYRKENLYLQIEGDYKDKILKSQKEDYFKMWLFLVSFVALFIVVVVLIFISNRRSKTMQIERLNFEFREQNIRKHMQPHFLFNMLNSIQDLIETSSSEKVIEVIEIFADIYKKILLGTMPYTWKLDNELEIIDSYFKLQKIRFLDIIDFELSIDEINTSKVFCPSLMIFTMIENSVDSLLALNETGGEVRLEISKKGEGFFISILLSGQTDSYAPFIDEIGLANIRSRLLKMYGTKAELKSDSSDEETTISFWVSGREYETVVLSPI